MAGRQNADEFIFLLDHFHCLDFLIFFLFLLLLLLSVFLLLDEVGVDALRIIP